MKLFIGILLGIFIQKAAVTTQWYTWMHYEKQCREVKPYKESIKCIEEKQGIFYYTGIASGTLTPEYGGDWTWRY